MNWIAYCIVAALIVFLFVLYSCERQKVIGLTSDNARLRRLRELENEERESEQWKEISSSYIVTDSDVVRYKTAKDIYYNARKRIATNIGFDIVKHFQPEESLTETGKTKYTYTFKIRK